MAYRRNITADDKVFFDTDQALEYAVYTGEPTTAQISAGTATPEDISGWSLQWVLRKGANATSALISKATGGGGITITGVYNTDPAVNTQRAIVQLDDTDTYDADASPAIRVAPGTYDYALKRIDAGSEKVLAFGSFTFTQAAAWE